MGIKSSKVPERVVGAVFNSSQKNSDAINAF
jgi:hypothetical protein